MSVEEHVTEVVAEAEGAETPLVVTGKDPGALGDVVEEEVVLACENPREVVMKAAEVEESSELLSQLHRPVCG